MTDNDDNRTDIPVDENEADFDNFIEDPVEAEEQASREAEANASATAEPPKEKAADRMGERLERLGGEPAPVITPEEFARLQKAGQVNIDSRGRVKTARRSDAEAGVSLRKRRAWYYPVRRYESNS